MTDGKDRFQYEMKCMMYSFGDSKDPNPETIALVEEITHGQVSEILTKAAEVSRLKGKRSVNVDDVLFLLRKNADKLRILLRHLAARDASKDTKTVESDAVDDIYAEPPSKKRKRSLDFLNPSEQASVESLEQDVTYAQTLQHMDDITKDMTAAEYMHYAQCRQANFHKNTARFKKWLEVSDGKFTQEVIEVLGYLAYETVKEIVELSLQVKEDYEHTLLHPNISHAHPPSSQFGVTPTFTTVPTNPSPGLPPMSPSSPPHGHSPPGSPSVIPNRHPSSKEGGHFKREAIHPSHVREAMRRYCYVTGPMAPLTAHFSKPTFYKRVLCA